jgi:hypothetical protein
VGQAKSDRAGEGLSGEERQGRWRGSGEEGKWVRRRATGQVKRVCQAKSDRAGEEGQAKSDRAGGKG